MDLNNIYYVYAYLREHESVHGPAGSPYYIGKGKHTRIHDKSHSVMPPKKENRIVLSEIMTEANALQLEMLLIYLYGRIDRQTGILRNLTDGGEGVSGRILSPETKQKISIANSNPSEKTRQLMSNINRGRKFSPDFVNKARNRQLGKKLSEDTKDRISEALMNHVVTEETRNKIAESNRGRPLSNAHRKKLSISHMGKTLSAESIEKRSAKNRGKICVTNELLKINKRIYPIELTLYEAQGFVRGFIKYDYGVTK